MFALKKSFPDKKIVISSVAIKEKIKELDNIKKVFDNKITFFYQPLKVIDGKTLNYSHEEKRHFSFLKYIVNFSRAGQICNAGQKLIVIGPTGDTFRCTTALKLQHSYSRNILTDDLVFYNKPRLCQEKSCMCANFYFAYKELMDSNNIL
jgi:hypothetical protein